MMYCFICDAPIRRGDEELWDGRPWCGNCEPAEQEPEPERYPQTPAELYEAFKRARLYVEWTTERVTNAFGEEEVAERIWVQVRNDDELDAAINVLPLGVGWVPSYNEKCGWHELRVTPNGIDVCLYALPSIPEDLRLCGPDA